MRFLFINNHCITDPTNVGATAVDGGIPRIAGASIDPNGRGGPAGGSDIGAATYDATSIHSWLAAAWRVSLALVDAAAAARANCSHEPHRCSCDHRRHMS